MVPTKGKWLKKKKKRVIMNGNEATAQSILLPTSLD